MMKYNTYKNIDQSGFTLIEVLVTLVIIAVGLLGLANIQLIGLKNNNTAYQRSQATIATYDMVERIRSNASEIASYEASVTDVEAAVKVAACTAAGCTTANMAATDLAEWYELLTQAFGPSVEGAITENGGIYNITIKWDEDRSGTIDGDDPTFQLSFKP